MSKKNLLPKGWKAAKLADNLTLYNGRAYKRIELLEQGKTPVIRIQNLNGRNNWFYSNLDLDENKYCDSGDLLFAWSATFGPYIWFGNKAIYHYHIWKIIPSKSIEKQFAFYYLLNLTESIKSKSHGVAFAHISKGKMEKLEFPLPPLPEQQRIVKKLDALFARIDEAIQLVEANLDLIPSLKMALLEKAFKGQLFGEVALGKNGLPLGWMKEQVKELSSSIQYGYTGKKQDAKNYYYVRITDIQGGQINWNNVPYSDISSKDAPKYTLNQGDILFARTGATVGKSYLFNDNVDAIFASYLIRVVVNQKIITPAFIYKFFQSHSYWRQVSNQVVGAAQPNVNGKKLGNLYITFPSIKEQNKIVNKLNQLFQNIDQLKTENQSKRKHLQDLKKSLLEQAFQGKL